MAVKLPPPPIFDDQSSFGWLDWQRQVQDVVKSTSESTPWANINFTGSNLTDILTKEHNALQSTQGGTAGEKYHQTAAFNSEISTYLTGGTPGYGWDDMLSDISNSKVAGVAVPTWSAFRNGIYAYSFSASAMNECWFSFHVTHSYKPNSKIYPHVHWSTAGTNTGIVRWGLEYTVAKGHNQEAFPATTTIYIEQAASGTAYKHMVTEVSDAQAFSSGVEPDSLILIRLFRDAGHANDTCTDVAFGLNCDIHYQTDRVSTKNKAPNFYT